MGVHGCVPGGGIRMGDWRRYPLTFFVVFSSSRPWFSFPTRQRAFGGDERQLRDVRERRLSVMLQL
jgi:hypothetical protein